MTTSKKFSFVPKEMFSKKKPISGATGLPKVKNIPPMPEVKRPIDESSELLKIPIHVEVPTPDWSLVPWNELRDVVEVLMHGAAKHSRDGWMDVVEEDPEHYRNHMMEHIAQYMSDNKNEMESGKSHLAHVICNALFLMWKDNQDE